MILMLEWLTSMYGDHYSRSLKWCFRVQLELASKVRKQKLNPNKKAHKWNHF